MIWLRQSTAVVVSFGPAVLFSDGVTLVTNLVGTGANQTENTSTGIRLSKNGGAFAARSATATASTYDAFGNYLVTLSTTDTGTLGALRMQYANASAFCPLFVDMMVVPAAVWDTYFASSGGVAFPTSGTLANTTNITAATGVDVTKLLGTAWLTPAVAGTPDVNAKQLGGTAQTGRDVGASVLLSAGTGAGQLDFTSGVVKSNLVQILATALTETAGLLAGGFKKFFNVASPTLTCLGVDQTGDSFARLGAPAVSVSADIAAIKSDTGTILTDVNTGAGAIYTRIGAPAGASIAADILTANNKVAGLTFTSAGKVDANALMINGDATAAADLAKAADTIVRGTCSGGTTTTAVVSTLVNPSSLTDSGQLIGRTILFNGATSTANVQGQASTITGSTTGATPTITFVAMTTAPANGDTFIVS